MRSALQRVAAASRGEERVLLVDTDPGTRDATTALLESLGYSVVRAGSPQEAMALLGGGATADLLFMDTAASDEGDALAVQARDRWPALRVLLTARPEGLPRASGPGKSFPTVSKPFERADVALRLREALCRTAPA